MKFPVVTIIVGILTSCASPGVIETIERPVPVVIMRYRSGQSTGELRINVDGTVDNDQVLCCPSRKVSTPERSLSESERLRVASALSRPMGGPLLTERLTIKNSTPTGTLSIVVGGRERVVKRVDLVGPREVVVSRANSPAVDDLQAVLDARLAETFP